MSIQTNYSNNLTDRHENLSPPPSSKKLKTEEIEGGPSPFNVVPLEIIVMILDEFGLSREEVLNFEGACKLHRKLTSKYWEHLSNIEHMNVKWACVKNYIQQNKEQPCLCQEEKLNYLLTCSLYDYITECLGQTDLTLKTNKFSLIQHNAGTLVHVFPTFHSKLGDHYYAVTATNGPLLKKKYEEKQACYTLTGEEDEGELCFKALVGSLKDRTTVLKKLIEKSGSSLLVPTLLSWNFKNVDKSQAEKMDLLFECIKKDNVPCLKKIAYEMPFESLNEIAQNNPTYVPIQHLALEMLIVNKAGIEHIKKYASCYHTSFSEKEKEKFIRYCLNTFRTHAQTSEWKDFREFLEYYEELYKNQNTPLDLDLICFASAIKGSEKALQMRARLNARCSSSEDLRTCFIKFLQTKVKVLDEKVLFIWLKFADLLTTQEYSRGTLMVQEIL